MIRDEKGLCAEAAGFKKAVFRAALLDFYCSI